MTTYVLVHGAWHGGWCWRPVADRLRAAGHEVVAPTLTGLAERAHLASPSVGLDTHVRDVVGEIEFADLTDVVLVGHSYAGMVVTGVAALVPERIRRLVVVDGFLPEAGEPAIELLPPHAAAHYRESATLHGDVWLIPPRPLANLGVTDPAAVAAITPRLTPHPLQTYLDGAAHSASALTVAGSYLLCAGWASPFAGFAEKAAELGFAVDRIAADHEVPLTDPGLLAGELMSVAVVPPADLEEVSG